MNVCTSIIWCLLLGSPGFYEFRLCDEGLETQACFDKHLLTIVDHDGGQNSTQMPVPQAQGLNIIHVQLPVGVQCNFCTLQWRFRKGRDVFWLAVNLFVMIGDILFFFHLSVWISASASTFRLILSLGLMYKIWLNLQNRTEQLLLAKSLIHNFKHKGSLFFFIKHILTYLLIRTRYTYIRYIKTFPSFNQLTN